MANITFGTGNNITVQSDPRIRTTENIPSVKINVKSIMKLQEEIVQLQDSSNFRKNTEQFDSIWKSNFQAQLNIV